MSNELWKKAVNEIDSKYTDRAAKSFRAESGRTVAVDPVLIYPPKDIRPKSRSGRVMTAAASAAAAAVLIAGGAFVISNIRSVPAEPEQTGAASAATSAAVAEKPVFEGGYVPENALRFTVSDAVPDSFTEVSADPRGNGWYGVSMGGNTLTIAKFDKTGGFTGSYSAAINFSDLQNEYFYNHRFTGKGFAVLMNTYDDYGLVNGTIVTFYNDDFEPVREYYNRYDGKSELYIALLSDGGNFLTVITRDTIDVVRLGTMSGYSVPLRTELAAGKVTINRALYAVPNENGSELLVISDDEPDAVDKEYATHITKIAFDGGEVVKAEKLGDEIIDANNSEPNRWGICTNNCLAYCGVYGGVIARYGFDGCQSALTGTAPGEELLCSASPDGLFYLAAVPCEDPAQKSFRIFHCEENELRLVKEYLPLEAEYSAVDNKGKLLIIDKNGSAAVYSLETQYKYEGFENLLHFYNFDLDLNAVTYSEVERPDIFSAGTEELSSGCTGSGDHYVVSGGQRNIVCRVTAPGGETFFYAPETDGQNETNSIKTEFHFTADGPAAVIRVYNDEGGLENGFIAFYDDGMTLRGVNKIELPDSFLGNTYITYDGKYLIDEHYSVYRDSSPYIRVYGIDATETRLIREIKKIGNFEYPQGADELIAENVIACNISKDGKKLIVLAEAGIGERNEAVFLLEDIETGVSAAAEVLQFDTRHLKYDLYDGGIAVFASGAAELLTENGAERFVFSDSGTDTENTEYAVSPDGRYFLAIIRRDTAEFMDTLNVYRHSEGIMEFIGAYLSQTDTLHDINNEGAVLNFGERYCNSAALDEIEKPWIEDRDIFDENAPAFETAADRANCLKYRALAEKLIDGGAAVTAGYDNGASAENGHKGIDISPADGENAPIRAYMDGTVTFADWGSQENGLSGYGKCVIIDHDGGYETVYAHCGGLYVREGDTVNEGDIIASAGATGYTADTRLHFELRLNGQCVDPA